VIRRAALAAALIVAACTPVPPDKGLPSARGVTLAPAAQGIAVMPTGQEIGFGRHRPGAVGAVSRVLARAPEARAPPPGCTLAAAAWPRDGLTMYFDGDAFVGWRAGGGRSFPGEPRSAGRVC